MDWGAQEIPSSPTSLGLPTVSLSVLRTELGASHRIKDSSTAEFTFLPARFFLLPPPWQRERVTVHLVALQILITVEGGPDLLPRPTTPFLSGSAPCCPCSESLCFFLFVALGPVFSLCLVLPLSPLASSQHQWVLAALPPFKDLSLAAPDLWKLTGTGVRWAKRLVRARAGV